MDTAQHIVIFTVQHLAAAVVHQHHMELLRAIGILLAPRSGKEGGIGRDLLAGGTARQQA